MNTAKKQWLWQKCEESGAVVESSHDTFRTLTDCMRDASDCGYWGCSAALLTS